MVGLSCSGDGLEKGASIRNGSVRAAGKAEGAERQGRLELPELWESQ